MISSWDLLCIVGFLSNCQNSLVLGIQHSVCAWVLESKPNWCRNRLLWIDPHLKILSIWKCQMQFQVIVMTALSSYNLIRQR
uniref:Putative ovule protein n=1 Tax=Solanum chacoense TaxID=4108 RepID=A0A0V0GSN8_SOLCH